MNIPSSIRNIAQKREQIYTNNNDIIRSYRHQNIKHAVFSIVRRSSFSTIILHYVICLALLSYISLAIFDGSTPTLIRDSAIRAIDGQILKNINNIIIATQATLTGIVFPIALGLITYIQQSSTTKKETEIYYYESLAMQLGSSNIALIIACAIYHFWPISSFISYFRPSDDGMLLEYSIGSLHVLWLCANAALGWHFIHTSLAFVNTENRKILRKRYTSNVSHPIEHNRLFILEEFQELEKHIYPYGPPVGLKIHIGHSFFPVKACVTRSLNDRRIINDVNPKILRWVIDRWWFRTFFLSRPSSNKPISLYITAPILSAQKGEFSLVSKDGGDDFTIAESMLIWLAFKTTKR